MKPVFYAFFAMILGSGAVWAQNPSQPFVPSQAQRQAQQQAPAQQTWVPNPQAVPMQGIPDHQLNRRVHEQLTNLRTYNAANFTIFSQGGFVTIQGRARNSDEAAAVIDEARKVSGVNNVISHIIIDPNL